MEIRTWGTVAVSALLVGSGTLEVAAARERWWPACPLGGFDAPACVRLQSHEFDFLTPADPWIPLGQAATLGGLSLLLLALAMGILPWLLAAQSRSVTAAASLLMGLGALQNGIVTLRSGQVGRPVLGAVLGPAGWCLLLGLLLMFVVASTPEPGDEPRPGIGWPLTLVGLLASSILLVQLLIAPIVLAYTSYDTTPWTEAVDGAVLLLAALAVWPATVVRADAGRVYVAPAERPRPPRAPSLPTTGRTPGTAGSPGSRTQPGRAPRHR